MSLENALSVLDESIRVTESSIIETQSDILTHQSKIQQLRSDSISLQSRIRERRAVILGYLTNIYSEGNSIIDHSSGDVDLIKSLILTTDSSDYTLSDITYKTLITQMGQRFVNEYRDLVRSYYLVEIQTKNETSELIELQTGLEAQSTGLIAQKSERTKLLEITQ